MSDASVSEVGENYGTNVNLSFSGCYERHALFRYDMVLYGPVMGIFVKLQDFIRTDR